MYVCICNAVTDKAIHRAVRNGARTLRELRYELNVATQCGRCAHCAKKCLHQALAAEAQRTDCEAQNDLQLSAA